MTRRKDETWYSAGAVIANLKPYMKQIDGLGIWINGVFLNKRNASYIRALQRKHVLTTSLRRFEELLTDCELQPSPIIAPMRAIDT